MRKLRRVLFKKWIPQVEKDEFGSIVSRGKMSDFVFNGVFHKFSTSYEELGNGVGQYVVAIIEDPEGAIHEITTRDFIFYDKRGELAGEKLSIL